MRRIWAYIILAFTALVCMGASFSNILVNVKANMEYRDGTEIYFRISDKDSTETNIHLTEEEGENPAVERIANEMIKRLNTADVSSFTVDTQGEDTIRVALAQESDSLLNNIVTYLTFDGSLALSNYNGDVVVGKRSTAGSEEDEENFLTSEKSSLGTINGYPAILLPVNTEDDQYKVVFENAKEGAGETSGEGDEAQTVHYLYLWYNFDVNTVKDMVKEDKREEFAQTHLLNKFVVAEDSEEQYYDDNKLFTQLNITSALGPTARKQAYENAYFTINLLNASDLPYRVTMMYKNAVTASIENILNLGDGIVSPAYSRALLASLAALLLGILFIIYYSRLGSIGIITMTTGATMFGFAAINFLTAEFNLMGIVALVLVALVSAASGIIYSAKFKDEAYRGRSVKKANTEAARKSLLPIVDINVALIVVGVFCYIFGGILMRTFAAVTVMGGLASLVLNLLGLRGMMWLATNASSVQNKYNYFGVDETKVPDLSKEEKQTYYGLSAGKDFSKKRKPFSVVAGVCACAALVCTILFSVLPGFTTYSNSSRAVSSKIYFETSSSTAVALNTDEADEFLSELYVYEGEDATKAKALSTYVEEYTLYESDYVESFYADDTVKTVNFYVIVAELKTPLKGSMKAYYKVSSGANDVTLAEIFDSAEVADSDLYLSDSKLSVSYKSGTAVSPSQPALGKIILGVGIALAVYCLYMMLRYKVSRGLSALVIGLFSGIMATGFYALVRIIAVSNYAIAALPVTIVLTMVLLVCLFNKERELILEDKKHDASFENRLVLAKRAASDNFGLFMMLGGLFIVVSISYFGFGSDGEMPAIFGLIALLVIPAVALTIVCVPNLSMFFKKLGSKIFKERAPRKSKKKAKVVNKRKSSAEPEEAVFIGIND